jgi:hypothetical protein
MHRRTDDWFALWTAPIEAARTAMAMGETAMQAQSVIAARLPVLFEAVQNPAKADHRELALMVTEKIGAAKGSAQSASASARTLRSAMKGHAATLGRLGGGEFPTVEMIRETTEHNLAIAASLVALPGAMLRPFHAGVAANARRLAGARR